MELLKKGIIIGLGAHDLNKKQIEEFVKKLQESKFITKEQGVELANLIYDRKNKFNLHIDSKIENFVGDKLKKGDIANLNHIEYLEKRIDMLEEELYNLLLEKYVDEVDDEEIVDLLKDLKLDAEIIESKPKKENKSKNKIDFDEDWLESEDLFNDAIDLNDSEHELDDLLCLPYEEEGKMFGMKKKTVKKSTTAKKPVKVKKPVAKKPVAAKKPVKAKKTAVKKPVVAKKPVKAKKPVATKKPATKKKTTKKAKK